LRSETFEKFQNFNVKISMKFLRQKFMKFTITD